MCIAQPWTQFVEKHHCPAAADQRYDLSTPVNMFVYSSVSTDNKYNSYSVGTFIE